MSAPRTYLDITQRLKTADGQIMELKNSDMMLIPDLLAVERERTHYETDYEADDMRSRNGWPVKPTKKQLEFIVEWNKVPLKPNKCTPMNDIQDWEKPIFDRLIGQGDKIQTVKDLRKVVGECGLFYLVRRCDIYLKARGAGGGGGSGGSPQKTKSRSRPASGSGRKSRSKSLRSGRQY